MGRFHRLAGSEFQNDGATKLNDSGSPKDLKYVLEFSKAFHLRIGGCLRDSFSLVLKIIAVRLQQTTQIISGASFITPSPLFTVAYDSTNETKIV